MRNNFVIQSFHKRCWIAYIKLSVLWPFRLTKWISKEIRIFTFWFCDPIYSQNDTSLLLNKWHNNSHYVTFFISQKVHLMGAVPYFNFPGHHPNSLPCDSSMTPASTSQHLYNEVILCNRFTGGRGLGHIPGVPHCFCYIIIIVDDMISEDPWQLKPNGVRYE